MRTTALHGRKRRGRIVRFDDEFDPVPEPEVIAEPAAPQVEKPKVASVPLVALAEALEQAKANERALIARIEAERQDQARRAVLRRLEAALAAATAALEAAKAKEAAWIARLRDEDELILMAA